MTRKEIIAEVHEKLKDAPFERTLASIRDAHRRLGLLLDAPEPGLFMWRAFLSDVLAELGAHDGKRE